jgi:hypothetical protein
MKDNTINIVNKHLHFPQVSLKEPLGSGFIVIAAEVDKKTSFWGESKAKKTLISELKTLQSNLENDDNILETTLFKASLFPPGRDGEYIKKRKQSKSFHIAYDIVLLIELKSIEKIKELKTSKGFVEIIDKIEKSSTYHFIFNAKNLRRIDSVNHKKKGVFLFNFFVAESKEQNLGIWEYTAGWFQDQTNLNNSTLFDSIDPQQDTYSVINHCRWDSFLDILPSLIFKKTFKTYVLENFAANDVAAIPILYKLA